MLKQLETYFKSYINQFKPYEGFWCYEDGVILKGAQDLYIATMMSFIGIIYRLI